MWTHPSAKAACCNMPGVLTVGRCLSSTYVKCVRANLQTLPQLNSTGLYNKALHSSICTPRVYVCPLADFLGVPVPSNGKGEALVSKHTQTPAYLRCLAGMIITVHCKHTHALIYVQMPYKSWGTPGLCSDSTWLPGNSTGIDWDRLPGASVGTCHWRRSKSNNINSSSHRFVSKHVLKRRCLLLQTSRVENISPFVNSPEI